MQLFDLIRSRLYCLTNLEAFTLKPPLTDTGLSDKLDLCLIQVLQMPTLKRLSIHVNGSRILKSISEYATPNLQTLEVLHSYWLHYFEDVMQQIPHLRRVSINLMSTTDLVQLFKIMINLRELNLSLYSFDGLKVMKIPDTLEKLHLEIDFDQLKSKHQKNSLYQPNLDMLSKLLSNFRNNLRYLSLIIFHAEEEFSDIDKFHSLVNHFDHLETFEYDIHTKYRPDQRFPNVAKLAWLELTYSAYSNPKPQSFDRSCQRLGFHRYALTSDLTRSQLHIARSLNADVSDYFSVPLPPSFRLSDDLKLVNLKEIQICKSIIDFNSEIWPFLSKIAAISPNLCKLVVVDNNTEDILLLLKQFITSANISRKISELELTVYKYLNDQNLTFFSNMADILPNLKSLSIRLDYEVANRSSDRLNKLIKRIRTDFHKLTNLELKVGDDNDYDEDDIKNSAMEIYKKILNELRHETGESLHWRDDYGMRGAFINVWM